MVAEWARASVTFKKTAFETPDRVSVALVSSNSKISRIITRLTRSTGWI